MDSTRRSLPLAFVLALAAQASDPWQPTDEGPQLQLQALGTIAARAETQARGESGAAVKSGSSQRVAQGCWYGYWRRC
jgi:hypothetical protein